MTGTIILLILGVLNILLTISIIGWIGKLRDDVVKQRDTDINGINHLVDELAKAVVLEDRRVLQAAKANSQAVVDNRILEILAILPADKMNQA